MAQDDPITLWINDLQAADVDAATKLWNHFVERVSFSARRMLNPNTQGVYDEDDVAISAFNSLFAGILDGRYPDLKDRDGLWRLLLVITSRKVAQRHRHDRREKRDVSKTFSINDSVFGGWESGSTKGFDELLSREPSPEFESTFAETCEFLFNELGDSKLQEIAALKMEGYTDSEIGTRLGCARSTVQRRLEMIRRRWQESGNKN